VCGCACYRLVACECFSRKLATGSAVSAQVLYTSDSCCMALRALICVVLLAAILGPVRLRSLTSVDAASSSSTFKDESTSLLEGAVGHPKQSSDDASPPVFEQVQVSVQPAGGNIFNITVNPAPLALDSYVALCAVVKDQPKDLVEWIEWHRCLGVRHFYIYDHNSTQPLIHDIWEYVQAGLVVYNYIKGWKMNLKEDGGFHTSVQYHAYNDCTKRARGHHTFLGYLDVDEFLVPTVGPGEDYDVEIPDLAKILKSYEPYGGLAVNWRFFGTSGHLSRPTHTAPESYTKCFAPDHAINRHVKVLGNLNHIVSISKENPHSLEYPANSTYFTVEEMHHKVLSHETEHAPSYSHLALYHYVTKSKQEYMAKIKRGGADGTTKTADWLRIIDVQSTEDCLDAVQLARACKMHDKIQDKLIPCMREW
jgi:hypothetical protein